MNVKASDQAALVATILSTDSVLEVDAEKVANCLGLKLASVPSKFTVLRKRYNLKIKLVNTMGAQTDQQNRTAVAQPDQATWTATEAVIAQNSFSDDFMDLN